jgi:hypothetical protein
MLALIRNGFLIESGLLLVGSTLMQLFYVLNRIDKPMKLFNDLVSFSNYFSKLKIKILFKK